MKGSYPRQVFLDVAGHAGQLPRVPGQIVRLAVQQHAVAVLLEQVTTRLRACGWRAVWGLVIASAWTALGAWQPG
ncbi:hypothetical protein [Paracidovorax konjaci]|uniref:Uncharacterized protein n=1 Tax=Paracidovorax konjaci TaxID=32040 RepID=A0A1I1UQU4_9BURK|nr:hypothetical protein [Paracidovorax konjaci]SFD73202.1 hypothetical protein SAMN04489710_105231 [Paracidovorax konjaci]